MTRAEKLWERFQARFSDRNFEFDDLRAILSSLGFDERIRGSHHIFTRPGIDEIVNLNPRAVSPSRTKHARCAR